MISTDRPLMNPLPQYNLFLPSDVNKKNKITYRPFLVKEQKILLMAQTQTESSLENIYNAIKNICSSCVISSSQPLVFDEMPRFDVEYLFLMIRCKSVGETTKTAFKCPNCSKVVYDVSIDLSKPHIDGTIHGLSKTITLNPDVHVTFSYPKMKHILQMDQMSSESDYDLISMCMESIQTKDTIKRVGEDLEYKDAVDFIDNLLPSEFVEIEDFFKKSPYLVFRGSFNCNHCGHENIPYEVQGTEDFFN